jgi:thymidine phosphorylase
MDAPLGRAVGNALEVIECIETLKARGPEDLTALVTGIAVRMLVLSGLFDAPAAEAAVHRALTSGAALEKMRAMIAAHGGDARVVDDYARLPAASHRHPIAAGADGYVASLRADLIGRAAMALGAGRQELGDAIDHGAGVLVVRRPGEPVRAGEPVLELHYNSDVHLTESVALAQSAVHLSAAPPAPSPLVLGTVV